MFKDLEFKVRGFGVFNGLGFRDLGICQDRTTAKEALYLSGGRGQLGAPSCGISSRNSSNSAPAATTATATAGAARASPPPKAKKGSLMREAGSSKPASLRVSAHGDIWRPHPPGRKTDLNISLEKPEMKMRNVSGLGLRVEIVKSASGSLGFRRCTGSTSKHGLRCGLMIQDLGLCG